MTAKFTKLVVLAMLILFTSIVLADWNPGDDFKMHQPQEPDPQGWDVCLMHQYIADDFECTESGPITDIHFWISWKSDYEEYVNASNFSVMIANDAGGKPGTVLWVLPASGYNNHVRWYGSGQQGWHCPSIPLTIAGDHYNIYQVNITDIEEPFNQTQGQIYWLIIRAYLGNPDAATGWKTTFQPQRFYAPAQWSTDFTTWNPVLIGGEMLTDMAFVITNDGVIPEEFDYGDAPDQPYPTLAVNGGAFHMLDGVTFMGAQVDAELDGQPTVAADGDDLAGPASDDEDGVTFNTPLIAGQPASITVVVSPMATSAMLDAWIDYNADGVWGPAEQLNGGPIPVNPGANIINFNVPAGATTGSTYARFRLSLTGGLQPGGGIPGTGTAPVGEVEDYKVLIEEGTIPDPNVKYVQWPDLTTNGIDIRVDDSDGVVRHIADDFPCTQTGPITDIHFWGSWENDDKTHINSIEVRIYSDDPVGIGGSNSVNVYSMPDILLWEDEFYANEFYESLYYDLTPDYEWWWDPYFGKLKQNGDHQVWQYDIYIDPCEAFVQQGTPNNPIVYWLEIQVNKDYSDSNGFGWKTSESHWNDDAVFANGAIYPWVSGWRELRYPEGHEYYPESLDMAFMITTGWEPNEVNEPKWEQLPDLSETGIDIDATEPFILADDFNCTKTGAITEIVVWGSWKDERSPQEAIAGNVEFTLSIHSDIPASQNPDGYSKPNDVLWFKKFIPGQFSYEVEAADIMEGWWTPNNPLGYYFPGDYVCWKYTFTIDPNEAFIQRGEPNAPIVYWLDVQAKPLDPTGETRFGWKTSLDHWNDDAVWGQGMEPYPGPWFELRYPYGHSMHQLPPDMNSIDLAFSIKTEPVPINDLGDAPDSTNSLGMPMTAYWGPGIMANFPTVYAAGSPPYGPIHKQPTAAFYLGNGVSLENEADIGPDADGLNNLDVPIDIADLDVFDDALVAMPYLPRCRMTKFSYTITVTDPTKPIFANVWFDFNRDGDWDDIPMCGSKPADEWAVKNQILTFAVPGTYTVTTPPFRAYDDVYNTDLLEIWMRITLSESPFTGIVGGEGPAGGYTYGETEDYFFVADNSCWSCADFDLSGKVDFLDLNEMALNWLWTGLPGGYSEADLDCDGDIQFTDFAILGTQWMQSCP